jgi:hypothetical protein
MEQAAVPTMKKGKKGVIPGNLERWEAPMDASNKKSGDKRALLPSQRNVGTTESEWKHGI